MEQPTVKVSAAADKSDVLQTITLGFCVDPIARWIWPEGPAYLRAMPRFADAFGGGGFEQQTVYLADDVRAAAMWLPPGVDPDEAAIETVIGETVAEERLEEIGQFFEQMDVYHPKEPVWYLALIAADPAFMGRGLGATLMKHALRRCDEDRTPAYLESSNPRNISLYKRHGFEVIGEIQVGSSPVRTPMLRQPRG